MYLIFDTETTGLPRRKNAPITDLENWPRTVQLAWQLHDNTGKLLSQHNYIIKPDGFDIPFKAEQVHGISTRHALEVGHELRTVLEQFDADLKKTEVLVGHNIEFDIHVLGAEYVRAARTVDRFMKLQRMDTCLASIEYCRLSGGIGGRLKMPKLSELYKILFEKEFEHVHNASYDVNATAQCFFALIKNKVIAPLDATPIHDIEYEKPALGIDSIIVHEKVEKITHAPPTPNLSQKTLKEHSFYHLHTHSQFSILQATPSVHAILAETKKHGMASIALTDLGNMYGAFQFVTEAIKQKIKPIVGCEFFISEERKKLKFTKDNPDKFYRHVLLAKNKTGYIHLCRLSSLGFTEGLYGIHPRIDKALIAQYREGLIATTGGLSGEISYLILHVGEKQAEKVFKWWHELFKDDFYAELNRHGIPEEDRVNEVLLQFCKKYGVRYFAANEFSYLRKEDSDAHDTLLCIKGGEFKSTPIGFGRGYRQGMPNNEFYFKSQEEMISLFHDLPEAIKTTQDIADKVELYDLRQDVLLPKYAIPKEFTSEDHYLRHLTYEGAKKRYPAISNEIRERIDFELETIKKTGYPGYFLIVQDFTNKATQIGVSVGPGRGSAAGSVVAYCIGITHVDPIAYRLLFERFLNPDRISLPDIDIDFDDEGREKVLQYVVEKYGRNQIAQIITYGMMAAKSSIRDCARVMELPLKEADTLAKMVPDRPGISLQKAFTEVKELTEIKEGSDLKAQVLKQATILEGSLRNTATHACGIIIAPCELVSMAPMAVSKDSNMLVTQYDNGVIEQAGMLKIDFLGLTTLTVIKTALRNIKRRHNIDIDIDRIPLDDKKTFNLYQRGDTAGTFQFESEGMQAYLRELKPDKFEDLIAMNALYRPGPMEYIPNFIARKHGREPVRYDIPEMEDILKETYGISVYQEQVMLLSQQLAGFSKGDADVLRKAMGKKQKDVLDKMKDQFMSGCMQNGHDERITEKIWKDWEAFAQYAFNKSHSTCYSLIAYQTAYLKAHYPAEYMASVLTHTQGNLDKVVFFIDDCKNHNINVLAPHINESGVFFEVNDKNDIRFGLGAIKGVGETSAKHIIEEREKQGPFKDIFEFITRLPRQVVTKKNLEYLALSGALDCFSDFHRRQFIAAKEGDITLTEKLIRYATKIKQEELSGQGSLFGHASKATMPLPKMTPITPFSEIEKLRFEKEVIGVYISGHPLDSFQFEIQSFCNTPAQHLSKLEEYEGKEVKIGGVLSSVDHRTTRDGKPFGRIVIEDYSGKFESTLWSDKYLKFKSFLMPGLLLFMEGTVVRKRWGNKDLEFNLNSIELLNDLGTKRTKGLQLKIAAAAVNGGVIDQIEALCSRFSGTCPLYIRVTDKKENIGVELLSRKYRINAVNSMISELKHIPELEVEIMH